MFPTNVTTELLSTKLHTNSFCLQSKLPGMCNYNRSSLHQSNSVLRNFIHMCSGSSHQTIINICMSINAEHSDSKQNQHYTKYASDIQHIDIIDELDHLRGTNNSDIQHIDTVAEVDYPRHHQF